MLRLHAMSLVGDLGADALRATRISKGFLGARGLSIDLGLMDLNPEEVRIKRELASVCERVICIAGSLSRRRSYRLLQSEQAVIPAKAGTAGRQVGR